MGNFSVFQVTWRPQLSSFQMGKIRFPVGANFKLDHPEYLPVASDYLKGTQGSHCALPRRNFWMHGVLHGVDWITVSMPFIGLGDLYPQND